WTGHAGPRRQTTAIAPCPCHPKRLLLWSRCGLERQPGFPGFSQRARELHSLAATSRETGRRRLQRACSPVSLCTALATHLGQPLLPGGSHPTSSPPATDTPG